MDRELLSAFRRRILEVIDGDLAQEDADAEQRRREVLAAVRPVIVEARNQNACSRVWLFGSFVWGRPGERSDIDLLVENAKDVDVLAADVWRAADRPVHVVPLERAPRSLVERVLHEGMPL